MVCVWSIHSSEALEPSPDATGFECMRERNMTAAGSSVGRRGLGPSPSRNFIEGLSFVTVKTC